MGAQVSVKMRGDKELARWLRKLGPEGERLCAGVILKKGHEVANQAKKELRTRKSKGKGIYPAYDTGSLAKSYGVDMDKRPGREMIATIGSNAAHAPSVELGRKPGSMPPSDALQGWVKRRLLKKQGYGRGAQKVETMDQVENVAFAVAKKIQREGSPAHPHLIPSFDRISRTVTGAIKDALRRLG